MPVIRTTPKGFASDLRRRLKNMPNVVVRGVKKGANRGRTHLTKLMPVDQGQLRASWRVQDASDILTKKREITLVNDAPHAGIIEEGARPHPVSQAGIEALTQWVLRNISGVRKKRRKKIGPLKQSSRLYKNIAAEEVAARSIAVAIAKTIEKEGYPTKRSPNTTHAVRNSMDQLRTFVRDAVVKEIIKASKQRVKRVKK